MPRGLQPLPLLQHPPRQSPSPGTAPSGVLGSCLVETLAGVEAALTARPAEPGLAEAIEGPSSGWASGAAAEVSETEGEILTPRLRASALLRKLTARGAPALW